MPESITNQRTEGVDPASIKWRNTQRTYPGGRGFLIRLYDQVCAIRVLRKDFIMLRKKAMAILCGALLFAVTGYAQEKSIRPFKISVSEESLAELRRRIAGSRWPE